ncbi:DNA-binding FadR family transcriptional regulator [Novosphingobium fluoreni]|uniref:DNA-binding FadR family transcriptional regulator n=1 Tax=Novosphingobium fluoreni TaxID=1391222 RepID=A0A7W6BYQ1_9SPHN|nr:FCD domain-containing protein [Novosphingobium fluoreni]KTR83635.1 GntR family transcriptional regulator [Novosphingobium barchaimii]MBB3940358.1 DNA-binding FadR family transcriptional regulator [Novosphingobium fluoreni]
MSVQKRTSRESLVNGAVAKLREMIVAQPPEAQIGSLPDLAKILGVGVVTVQQAARVLEHEGFLQVRRGPGGGYYGTRPGAEGLSRAISGFLSLHHSDYPEAIDIITLLDCELMAAAARTPDEKARRELTSLIKTLDDRNTPAQRGAFDQSMLDILYLMVDRPLMELLSRMAVHHYAEYPRGPLYGGSEGKQRWRRERRGIISAILDGDPERARFEAQRRRREIMRKLDAGL